MENYTEAAQYLQESETLAKASGNIGWQGWVTYRSGILYIRLEQFEKAIENYQKSLELCKIAGDSLCVGESLEQLGALNGVLDNHEEAEEYYNQAMPLIKKYGAPKSTASLLTNYGSLLSMKGDLSSAVPILEESIDMNLHLKRYGSAAKGMNNLGSNYQNLGQYEKAIEQYEKAIKLNTEHHFSNNMIRNYLGLHIVYSQKKEYKKAMDFLMKRDQLKDSLIGQQTQLSIANLEAKYNAKNKELELEKTQSKLLSTKVTLERTLGTLSILLLLLGFGFWYFRSRNLHAKNQKEQAQKDLEQLSKILVDKNAAILSLNTQLSNLSNLPNQKGSEQVGENFINMTILTSEEWVTYKSKFEKLYPGFLSKLRLDYPELSDAEERLFLLIKLQLKTREIAAILGILQTVLRKHDSDCVDVYN